MKKVLKILLIIVPIFLVIVGIVLFLQLNRVVKATVETIGPKALGAPVALENVNISIFSGKGTLSGLRIGNPEGFKTDSAFELGRLLVEFDTSTLKSDVIHIREIIIEAPTITFEGLKGGNIKQLEQNVTAFAGKREEEIEEAGADDKAERPKKVVIDHLQLTGGLLNYAPLWGISIAIPLPDIEMKNVGEASGGVTVASVVAQILAQIDDVAVGAIDGSEDAVSDALGEAAKSAAGKASETLKGLFTKEKKDGE